MRVLYTWQPIYYSTKKIRALAIHRLKLFLSDGSIQVWGQVR